MNRQKPAIQGKGGDDQTYKVAAGMRDYGLPPEKNLELMLDYYNPRCEPPWDVEDLTDKVRHANQYGQGKIGSKTPEADFKDAVVSTKKVDNSDLLDGAWTNDMFYVKKGPPIKNNYFNTRLMVQNLPQFKGAFVFDELCHKEILVRSLPFHTKKEIKNFPKEGEKVTERHHIGIQDFLSQDQRYITSAPIVAQAISYLANKNRQHPIRNLLNSLPEWDGVKRINTLFIDHFGVEDTPYAREVARVSFNGAISRIMHPGCKYDYVPTLEGDQGIGKSEFLVDLFYNKYFLEDLGDITNKDVVGQMQGKWGVELAEMRQQRLKDVDDMKKFITTKVDTVRLAYARDTEDYLRQQVLYGTTNRTDYLKDETGNRRFLPMETTKAPEWGIMKKLRDQIWAEAFHVFKKVGIKTNVDASIVEEAFDQQHKRLNIDERSGDVEAYLDKKEEEIKSVGYIKGKEIWTNPLDNLTPYDSSAQYTVRKIMSSIRGWKHKQIRDKNGKRIRAYVKT